MTNDHKIQIYSAVIQALLKGYDLTVATPSLSPAETADRIAIFASEFIRAAEEKNLLR